MSSAAESFRSVNPATGETLAQYRATDPQQLSVLLSAAERASHAWPTTTVAHRAAALLRLAELFDLHLDSLAALITDEMGKPILEARAEVAKCAACCRYYASQAESLLAPVALSIDSGRASYTYRPLGILLGIMPWNYPFWQAMRFAVPALIGGNVALLKPASNVVGCAQALERLFQEAGFPAGAFTVILVPSSEIETVIADPRVRGVSLTGSERAGSAVAAIAGRYLKKTVLELGGSDPFIVCEDAHLDAAIEGAVKGRFQNAGQSCIAAKRFLIDRRVYEPFLEGYIAAVRRLVIGDPRREATTLGPLARHDFRAVLQDQVDRSIAMGAEVALAGGVVDPAALPVACAAGAYFAPIILRDVSTAMPVMREEVFGPVAAVRAVVDIEEAIAVANDSPYGLSASLWSRDLDRTQRLAARIESGALFINQSTASDPRLPFGGVKRSGYGRELAMIGPTEFLNCQTLVEKDGP